MSSAPFRVFMTCLFVSEIQMDIKKSCCRLNRLSRVLRVQMCFCIWSDVLCKYPETVAVTKLVSYIRDVCWLTASQRAWLGLCVRGWRAVVVRHESRRETSSVWEQEYFWFNFMCGTISMFVINWDRQKRHEHRNLVLIQDAMWSQNKTYEIPEITHKII